MYDLYQKEIGARPIYIIQRPYIRISSIITVYLSYLAADMAKKKTTNGTMSPSASIPFGTKSPEPTPLTLPTDSPILPMEFPEQHGKLNVPGYPDTDP